MSAKISATRRKAFLEAVAETGNQTLAAERPFDRLRVIGK